MSSELSLILNVNNEQKQNEEEDDKNVNNEALNEVKGEEKECSLGLAVPMVADSLSQSITRDDAKKITEGRLKRLKTLSERAEDNLSKHEQDEKKRIIRLEKNRRAAAMSRRKKMYVKGLEDKNNLLQRYLSIAEMENAHLRALLHQHKMNGAMIPNVPLNHHTMPPFKVRANSEPPIPSNGVSSNDNTTTTTSIPGDTKLTKNTKEPSTKRRKLNDGSSLKQSPLNDAENSTDIILEPLSLETQSTNNSEHGQQVSKCQSLPIPTMAPRFMPFPHVMPPKPALIAPPRIIPFPTHSHPQPYALNVHQINTHHPNQSLLLPQINVDINKQSEHKEIEEQHHSDNGLDMPPPVEISEFPNFLGILSDDEDDMLINERVDECGSLIGFE